MKRDHYRETGFSLAVNTFSLFMDTEVFVTDFYAREVKKQN